MDIGKITKMLLIGYQQSMRRSDRQVGNLLCSAWQVQRLDNVQSAAQQQAIPHGVARLQRAGR